MKILCVAEDFPWPAVTGFRIRLGNVVRALTALGDVDLFVALNDGRDPEPCEVPPDVELSRVAVVHERPPKSKAIRLLRWTYSGMPLELLWRRWTRARRTFKHWRRDDYDLVWFGHIDGQVALGDLVDGPFVVDLDDLHDQRLLHRQAARSSDAEAQRVVGGRRSFAHQFARRHLDPRDVDRWARLQRDVVEGARAVAVSSELDRRKLDDPKVVVVSNGYELPADPGARAPRDTAVLTLVGGLWYGPNADGAWWFATEVLPKIRGRRDDASFRLVGRTDELVEGLRSFDDVDFRGQVPDVGVELSTTDVSVVPLRSGGGTRVKILEAFGYRVPVVSTSVGCEGLEVEDGVHLLVADTPAAFADACMRLLEDHDLAQRITSSARALAEERYSWARLRPRVTDIAARAAGQSTISQL